MITSKKIQDSITAAGEVLRKNLPQIAILLVLVVLVIGVIMDILDHLIN